MILRHQIRKHLSGQFLFAASAVALALAAGCGGSSSQSSPQPPDARLGFESFLVDIGDLFELNGSASTSPRGGRLDYQWSFVNSDSASTFADRCGSAPAEKCTVNADCSVGSCAVGFGDSNEFATFGADVAGPYSVRLVADDGTASATDVRVLQTHPSLFVVGSLRAFGGTSGTDLGEFGATGTFATGAVSGASNPADGNIFVIVPTPAGGIVREFDLRTGQIIANPNDETDSVSDPQALAFDGNGQLFIADADGTVSRFAAQAPGKGLFLGVLGDVTAGSESVAAMAFSPVNGALLVVDGAVGAGLRRYNENTGNPQGVFGDTAGAAGRAVDLAFLSALVCRHDTAVSCNTSADCEALSSASKCMPGDAALLLIADATGDVIACDPDGTSCASFGSVAASVSAPTSVVANPSGGFTDSKVLISDPSVGAVIGCGAAGNNCTTFGATSGVSSAFKDIFFAPPRTPTTTTTTTTLPTE